MAIASDITALSHLTLTQEHLLSQPYSDNTYHIHMHVHTHSHADFTFFFGTERYSSPVLRSLLRLDFFHSSTFLFRFFVGVSPVLGPHSQPSGWTLLLDPEDEGLTEEPLEEEVSICPAPADGPALDVEGPVAIFVARGARSRSREQVMRQHFDWSMIG